MGLKQVDYEVVLLGVVVDNWPRYELVCTGCGGCEQDDVGDPGVLAMVYCRACRGWMGRRSRINVAAFQKARASGVDLDLTKFRDEIAVITRAASRLARPRP